MQQLHHNEGTTVGVADVVYCADVGMLQSCDRSGFAREPLASLRGIIRVRRDDFDCDVSSEAPIARLVDLAHTTGAERRGNFVWAKADASAHAKGRS
jgi:hypothetical protein